MDDPLRTLTEAARPRFLGIPLMDWFVAAIVVGLMVALYLYGQRCTERGVRLGRQEVQALWDTERIRQADDAIRRQAEAAQKTRTLLAAQEAAAHAAQAEAAAAAADRDRAVAAAGRLRHALDDALAAARHQPGPDRPAAPGFGPGLAGPDDLHDPVGAIADVSRLADDAAGRLGDEVAALRRAGLECERDYDAVRAQVNQVRP